MMALRTSAWLLSGDLLRVEQRVIVVDLVSVGNTQETVEAVDVSAAHKREEPQREEPPIEEVKPVEFAAQPADTSAPVEAPRPELEATREEPAQVAAEAEQSATVERTGGEATLHTIYLGKLHAALERSKVNPRSRDAGTVVVRVTVAPSGLILSHEITSSSGSQLLDAAAVAALDRAQPFPPFPEGLSPNPLVVSVPFRFRVR